MNNVEYKVISTKFKNTADVPKDIDIFYRCTECKTIIPSVPNENIGCECGNIFIDKDCWRLIVVDFSKFEAIRKKREILKKPGSETRIC